MLLLGEAALGWFLGHQHLHTHGGGPETLEIPLPTSQHCPNTEGSLPVFDLPQIQERITLPVSIFE